MWLFQTDGFLSVVAHRDDPDLLMVRARVREDLLPVVAALAAGDPIETPDADYRWRVTVDRGAFASFIADAIRAIDYDNFKGAVAARQGHGRARRYGRVWETMHALQAAEHSA